MPGIYVLLDPETQYLKIGRATDLESRLVNLRTANPRLQLIDWYPTPFGSSIEAYLHGRLVMHRRQGEFFEIDINTVRDELTQAISETTLRPTADEIAPIERLTELSASRLPNENELRLLSELLDIRAEKTRLEWREESILAQIKRSIGGASGLDDWATYTLVERKSLDTKALREVLPDIADRFTRISISRTLRIKPYIRPVDTKK
jgi:hypothetical protein